jgi:ABC-type transporter Mla subunit MlaD
MGAGQKFVPNGVMLMCNGGVAPGRLNVIPKNVMLDGQIFATELDTMPFVNIPSFGACQRLRYCPPCMPAPTGWKDVCDDGVKVMGARPLLEKSTNSCAIGGKITIMFVPPGGFSGSFTGITPSGLPDMSALSGGDGFASLASNPAAAISNVGGVASLANVGSGGLTSITNLGSNVLSSAAGGVNALRQAASGQTSGMLNHLISGVAGGLSGITSGFGQMVSGFGQAASAIQSTMQQGNVFFDRINGYVGSVSQFGGTLARWTGNTRLQDAMMRLANQIGNAKNKLNNTINQIGTYKDALSGANGYFGKATDFLNNFKKSMENGELGKQWTAFIAKLGTKAQSFFENFKRGISDLKNVKYPDTIAAWLETSKGGLERLSGHANNLSISFTNAKSYLSKSSERIKTFGGVVSTLTGNPNAQAAASKWAAQWDNAANKMGNYATKATVLSGDFKNGAEFTQTGAEWAKKASDFLSKDSKTGDLKQQWDAFTERLGTQASAFFDKIKTNAANLQNIPYPDTAAGWLAAGGEGFTRLSGNLNKATNRLNDLKGDLAKGTAQIRSFGGTLSRITGNKKLEEWAAKWNNATNKVGNAINQGNKYVADAKSYGDKLKSGSQYVEKLDAFFKEYQDKTPVGNPFQNWGTSVSNWISGLKKLPIEAPRAGSVKELLGDITKISDKIGVNMTGLGDYLGKSVQRANEFAGVLSLLDKDAAAKVQKLAAETAALQQKAAEIKAKAEAVKAKIEKAKQDLDKAKAALQKASALWAKMKEKLPDFSKGADLFQQYLPKLPEIASIAAVIKAFPAIDSIVNASQVANAFSSSITNSFANISFNNVFANNSTSSVTQTGAIKAGSASVSASGGGGMGVVNGSSRIGTITVQKVSVSLPDMSDKNPNEPKKQNNNTVAPQPTSIKPVRSKPDSMARKQAIEMAIAKNKAEREIKLAAKKLQQQLDNEADRKKVEEKRKQQEEETQKREAAEMEREIERELKKSQARESQKAIFFDPKIISRKEWGARQPIIGDKKRNYEPITIDLATYYDTIVIHHGGNKVNYPTIKYIQDLHMNGDLKAADIGYHYAIDRFGNIYEGRPINIVGSHVKGANTGKIGIILLADLDTENKGLGLLKPLEVLDGDGEVSENMRKSLKSLVKWLNDKYGIEALGSHTEVVEDRNCAGDLGQIEVEVLRKVFKFNQPVKVKQPQETQHREETIIGQPQII